MRNTARTQVIALALFGALAWVSLDVTDLRTAAADFLFPKQVEDSMPTPEFDIPALGEEPDSRDRRPKGSDPESLLLTPAMPMPAHGTWVSPEPPPLVVG